MNDKQKFLLTNYRKHLEKDEALYTQWFIECWDGNKDVKYPKWLEEKLLFAENVNTEYNSPEKLVHKLCLKILSVNKSEIEFPEK